MRHKFQYAINGHGKRMAVRQGILSGLPFHKTNIFGELTWAFVFFFLSSAAVQAAPNVIAWDDGLCCSYAGEGETNVPVDLTNAIAIAAGGGHSMALRSDGTVSVWGRNTYGETNIPSGLSNVVAVAAGYHACIALRANGTVVVWGENNFGQTNVPPGLSNVVAIAGSEYDVLVLHSDGTVLAWGGGPQTNIPVGLSNVVAISSGFYDNLALKSDGTVVAWGSNASVTNVPANLTNVMAINCSMSESVQHSLAVLNDGTVVSWGYTQAPVPVDLSNVCAVAGGGVAWATPALSRDLALKSDGSLVGWGSATNVVTNQTNIIAIASGDFHQLALVGNSPPIQSIRIQHPVWSETNFSVEMPAQSGRVYALEFKDHLTDTNWTALPLVAGNGGMITLRDWTGTESQRYYRVRRW